MNTDYASMYTKFAFVVDRSGSMASIASDVRGSVTKLIGDQKKLEGKADLTLVQFDNEYEIIYNDVNIQNVNENEFAERYDPRGSTALLDAIGRTTLAMQKKIDTLPETERPSRVVVAIITDGLENSSQEFNIAQIKEMISKQKDLGWDFMFLGATLDAIDVAKSYGISVDAAAVFEVSKMHRTVDVISKKITDARHGKAVTIDEEERAELRAQQSS